MAWIIKRKRRGPGRPWLHVQWRDGHGKIRSMSLRTTDMRVALAEKARIEVQVEGRIDAPVEIAAHEALERFLIQLEVRQRLKKQSINVYRERLVPLFRSFASTPLKDWSRQMVGDYLDAHPHWGPRTIQLTINSCKVFIKWCRNDGLVTCPDFVGEGSLGPRVRPKVGHDVYSLGEIAALLDVVRGEPCGNRWIDLAVNLAFWAGLSIGDIDTIEWRHVDLEEATLIKPREKTGTLISAPLATPLVRALRWHPGISGRIVPNLPRSCDSARKSFRVKTARAGIRMRPSGERGFHLLRHTLSVPLWRTCKVGEVEYSYFAYGFV